MTKEASALVERLRHVGPPSEDIAVPIGSFMRGLALGALVGAAIAGSTIWNRRQHRRRAAEVKAAELSGTPESGRPTP